MEQPTIVERPPLSDPVTTTTKTRDDLPVRLERLLVAAEHGEDHRTLRLHCDLHRAGGVGTVEGGHGVFAEAGQHECTSEAEAGLGGQVGFSSLLGGHHCSP